MSRGKRNSAILGKNKRRANGLPANPAPYQLHWQSKQDITPPHFKDGAPLRMLHIAERYINAILQTYSTDPQNRVQKIVPVVSGQVSTATHLKVNATFKNEQNAQDCKAEFDRICQYYLAVPEHILWATIGEIKQYASNFSSPLVSL